MKWKEGGRYGKQVKLNANQFATNNYNLTELLHNMIQYLQINKHARIDNYLKYVH